jgi:hypothetical protein
MKAWYQAKTHSERRALIARRDPERVKAADRRKYVEAPEKHNARKAVGRALRIGKLQRGLCEQAGPDCTGRIEAHHDDYAKPLEVRWLCAFHHVAIHHPPSPGPAPLWVPVCRGCRETLREATPDGRCEYCAAEEKAA